MVTHIFLFPAFKSVQATGQRAIIIVVVCWKLSFLAEEEKMIFIKQLVLAGVRHRSVATVWNISKPIAFYSEEKQHIFSSSLTIPVVCKDPTYCFVIKFVFISC